MDSRNAKFDRRMSRNPGISSWYILALVFIGYFLAACAFGLFLELRRPFASIELDNTILIGRTLERGAGLYLLSGAIPMVFWAFRRFRSQSAMAPLVVWAFLAVSLGAAMERVDSFDMRQKLYASFNKVEIAGADRDEVIRNIRMGCIEAQRQSELNRQIGITNQQTDAYCECFANGMIDLVTADDLRYLGAVGKPSARLQKAIDRIAPTCNQAMVGK